MAEKFMLDESDIEEIRIERDWRKRNHQLKDMHIFKNERDIFTENDWWDTEWFQNLLRDRNAIYARTLNIARRRHWDRNTFQAEYKARVRRWYVKNKWLKKDENRQPWQKAKIYPWAAIAHYRELWKSEHKGKRPTPEPPRLTAKTINKHEQLLRKRYKERKALKEAYKRREGLI